MTVLLNIHQLQPSHKTLLDSAVIKKARSDKNQKHNYPKTRKPRTIDYAKKIENDEFLFDV